MSNNGVPPYIDTSDDVKVRRFVEAASGPFWGELAKARKLIDSGNVPSHLRRDIARRKDRKLAKQQANQRA